MAGWRPTVLIACVSILGILCGSSLRSASRDAEFRARWRTAAIAVDGDVADWQELGRVENSPLSAAFVNDGEALYICVIASEASARRQVMSGGLEVWLDGEGGKKKRFGLRFPAVDRPGGRGGPGMGERGEGDAPERPPAGQPPDDQEGRLMPRGRGEGLPPEVQRQVELLGAKDKDARTVRVVDVPGLALRLGSSEGRLVWEARLPLHTADAWTFEAAPGQVIGVGFETVAPRRPSGGEAGEGRGGPEGGRGGPPPGGMGGGMGGPPGVSGGMGRPGMGGPPRGMGESARTIKVWTTVQLARAAQ